MDIHELPYRIKSARRKKRLVKTDRDKQLISLDKRRNLLDELQAALPMVPLENPYQRGWKRFFVLRADIVHSPRAEFYNTLLQKINTFEYHHDKSFKRKKRRRGRYGYEIKRQSLRELTPYLWQSSKLNLSEQEKACFGQVETYDIKTRRPEIKYVFTEPWRYVLKIAPHMVTHKQLFDADIRQEIGYIDDHITRNNLNNRIHVLTNGRKRNAYKYYNSFAKYGLIKKLPKYNTKEAYYELDI
ncbi:hypothetical protein [Pedobacter sp. UBA5917]|jgi:hypothetical protein|uniref:hypothetical protein n=1 Tax=Pedobacter sp. UBA5917 TaxID=1947061 RepID=UPI0025FE42C1|nr:hypothetical protein [Pedobacter sp. UBA5917]